VQGLSGDLEEILVSKFQAGAHGFRALVELENPSDVTSDYVPETGGNPTSQDLLGGCFGGAQYYPSTHQPSRTDGLPNGDSPLRPYTASSSFSGPWVPGYYSDTLTDANGDACWPGNCTFGMNSSVTLEGGASWEGRFSWDLGAGTIVSHWMVQGIIQENNPGCWAHWSVEHSDDGTTWTTDSTIDPGAEGSLQGSVAAGPHRYWSIHIAAGQTNPEGGMFTTCYAMLLWGGTVGTAPIPVKRISIDKSLQTDSDGLEVVCELAAMDEALWSAWLPLCVCDRKIWVHQWYGDDANKIQTFYGFLDKPDETRDSKVREITLTARDWMKNALVQSAIVSYPQAAGASGAVRDPSNYVYLNMQVSDIVLDLLTHLQFPSAHVTTTDYLVADFEVTDGTSFAAAFSQLATMVGFQSFADEQGGYHFDPIALGSAAYTFHAGVDMLSLERASDEYELATRVKVVGKDSTRADVVAVAIAGVGLVSLPEPQGVTGPMEASLNNAIRRVIVNETAIATTTEAGVTALAQLAKQDGFRRIFDFGIVGHPGLQKGDTVGVVDPVMGEDSLWLVDTYRTEMTVVPGGAGTYVGIVGGTLVD
jgi:hypothetical protein